MRYAGIIRNDIASAPGICLTYFAQGCKSRCKGCHNPETWCFNEGKEFTQETLNSIISGLTANGISRSLAIQGGEPLCEENQFLTNLIITEVRKVYPDIKIYLWTGYLYEDLLNNLTTHLRHILSNIDYLIDGPYIEEQRDLTLWMRGSRNQKIYDLKHQEKKE
jgi:anaerobic ribonucleoside-triphosphate reductase activating protein